MGTRLDRGLRGSFLAPGRTLVRRSEPRPQAGYLDGARSSRGGLEVHRSLATEGTADVMAHSVSPPSRPTRWGR